MSITVPVELLRFLSGAWIPLGVAAGLIALMLGQGRIAPALVPVRRRPPPPRRR